MGLEPIRWEGRGLGLDLYVLGAAALACAAHMLSDYVETFVPCEGVCGLGLWVCPLVFLFVPRCGLWSGADLGGCASPL